MSCHKQNCREEAADAILDTGYGICFAPDARHPLAKTYRGDVVRYQLQANAACGSWKAAGGI